MCGDILKFKLVEKFNPYEDDILCESKSDIESLIQDLSDNKYKVKGFFSQFPEYVNIIETVDKINLSDYEVHHISSKHSTQKYDYSNDLTNLVLLPKNLNIHKEITAKYVDKAKEIIKSKFNTEGIDEKESQILATIAANNDLLDVLALAVQRLTNAGIDSDAIFTVNIGQLRRINKILPMKLSSYFEDLIKNIPGAILFTDLKCYEDLRDVRQKRRSKYENTKTK